MIYKNLFAQTPNTSMLVLTFALSLFKINQNFYFMM